MDTSAMQPGPTGFRVPGLMRALRAPSALALLLAVFLLTILLAGCSSGPGNGTATPAPMDRTPAEGFQVREVSMTLWKTAPYTTYLDGIVACADFAATPIYNLEMAVETGPVGNILEVRLREVTITQPKVGTVGLSGAVLGFGSLTPPEANGKDILLRPLSGTTLEGGDDIPILVEFASETIGKYTLREYTTIAGTHEEAAGYFDQFVTDAGLTSDDLRFVVSFRLEIRFVDEDGKDATCFSDCRFDLLPGDFLAQPMPVILPVNEPFYR